MTRVMLWAAVLLFIQSPQPPANLRARVDVATQTRRPTGNGASNYWSSATGGNKWDDVDEESPDNETTYINATSSQTQTFTFQAFDISSAEIANLTIYWVAKRTAAGANSIQALLRVGGSNYQPGSAQAITTSWALYSETLTTNPRTGVAWTEADIEGTSANQLQAFGISGSSVSVGEEQQCTQVYAVVTYTPASAGNPYYSYAQQ